MNRKTLRKRRAEQQGIKPISCRCGGIEGMRRRGFSFSNPSGTVLMTPPSFSLSLFLFLSFRTSRIKQELFGLGEYRMRKPFLSSSVSPVSSKRVLPPPLPPLLLRRLHRRARARRCRMQQPPKESQSALIPCAPSLHPHSSRSPSLYHSPSIPHSPSVAPVSTATTCNLIKCRGGTD